MRRSAGRADKRIFGYTARITRAVNLHANTKRGGIRF